MFPRPIERASKTSRVAYQSFLPFALFLWLLPLLAIFLTSMRGSKDINTGNVFGWPTEFKLIENYYTVFAQTIGCDFGFFGMPCWLCIGNL